MRCNPRILTPCLTAWRAVPLLLQEVPARPCRRPRATVQAPRRYWTAAGRGPPPSQKRNHCRPLFAWGWMAWVPSDELPRARHGLLQGRCPPLSPTAAAKARKKDLRWTRGRVPELDGMDPANPPDGE